MNKTAIITDSSSDLPKGFAEQNNIFVLPLQVNMPDGTYQDGIDITSEEVYDVMPEVIPTTSQPSPGQIIELIERIKREGYEQAIIISISAELSGTYNMYKMVAREESGIDLRVFNSRRLSMALGHLVMYAVELRDEGRGIDEIMDALEDAWEHSNGMFCIPTLKYLLKGGRIGLVAGTIGTILGIVPVISINEEGKYYTELKTRNYNIAIKKMADKLKEIVKDKIAEIAIVHGDALDKAKELMNNLKDTVKAKRIFLSSVSPALGVHTGRGLVGITYRIIRE